MNRGPGYTEIILLQKIVSKALQMDPSAVTKLAKLAGRIIMIDVKNSELILYLIPSTKGLNIYSHMDAKADVTVTTTPLNLINFILLSKTAKFPNDMEIIGDISILRQLQKIFLSFDPDFEEALAKIIGDPLTHQLHRGIKSLKRTLSETGNNLLLDSITYLRFEKNLLQSNSEIETFCNDSERLKLATERLEKQFEKYAKRLRKDLS